MSYKLQEYTPEAKLRPSAVKLLRKVRAAILRYPEKVDMNDWIDAPRCGTAACIGGWCCIIAHGGMRKTEQTYKKIGDFGLEAVRLLGFKPCERLLLYNSLFTTFGFCNPVGTKAYAKEVADRIDSFIAQHT